MKVGDIVELKVICLRNPVGAEGVVFYVYDGGFQVIFSNGKYDGFSEIDAEYSPSFNVSEAEFFLKKIGHDERLASYKFTNVIQLSQDFERGLFFCRPYEDIG